jgi:glutamate N-acetyltransferase / amino-acid N-acetyltransferase
LPERNEQRTSGDATNRTTNEAESPPMLLLPTGFTCHVTNVGIRDTTDDFTVLASDRPCTSAAMFTTSRFAGPSVVVSREHASARQGRAVVVISKNANVATGPEGLANAREVTTGVAAMSGCATDEVFIASTGVIGRQYPMAQVRAGLAALQWPFVGADAEAVARGIMTTDTHPKFASAHVGGASIVGVAKGVGMIEPDMATSFA